MTIFDILKLIGGVGLFLYGMKYLGASLEHMAGAGLEKTLEKLTGNRFKGLAMGTMVTAVIQSSAATTIMLVGFVNAGIMNLAQTIPVLMGANIGTTITGQILRLGDIGSEAGGQSLILELIKPSSFAPLIIGIAAFIMLLSKNKKANDIAGILMGFGVLFFGMNTMETALDPLKSSPDFQQMFTTFTNPLIGMLLGILLAAILQSSSAAVGVLQAIAAATGNITLELIAPMVIGISIGKLFPIILASLGTKKEAKQVALSQLLISSIGGIVAMLVVFLILFPLGIVDKTAIVNRGSIADFNTLYNICASIVLFPFCGLISATAKKLIKSSKPSKIDQELRMLDPMLLKTPSVALDQCRKVINGMGTTVIENYGLAMDMHTEFNEKTLVLMTENEQFLDKSETLLSDYLVRLSACKLREDEQKLSAEIMHSIMDFERMGDHCIKISDVAEYNRNQKIVFSDPAREELDLLNEPVSEVLRSTVASFTMDNEALAFKVEPLREVIVSMCEVVKEHHVQRLQKGECTVQSGISLVECLTSFERISAYCSNVALHVIERYTDGDSTFDMHEYTKQLRKSSTEYRRLKDEFSEKYLQKLAD